MVNALGVAAVVVFFYVAPKTPVWQHVLVSRTAQVAMLLAFVAGAVVAGVVRLSGQVGVLAVIAGVVVAGCVYLGLSSQPDLVTRIDRAVIAPVLPPPPAK
jgi:hypothetical protein